MAENERAAPQQSRATRPDRGRDEAIKSQLQYYLFTANRRAVRRNAGRDKGRALRENFRRRLRRARQRRRADQGHSRESPRRRRNKIRNRGTHATTPDRSQTRLVATLRSVRNRSEQGR